MRLSAEKKNNAHLPAAEGRCNFERKPHTHHQQFPSPALVVGGLLPQAVMLLGRGHGGIITPGSRCDGYHVPYCTNLQHG